MSATDHPTTPNIACEHKEADHVHGTHACYVLDQCRCDDCRGANARYERGRALYLAGVKPHPYTDARPVRAHVRQLMDQGMGLKRIAEVSGVPHGALWKLVYGKKKKGRNRRSKKVRRDTARKLLSTRLDLADGAKVPAGEAWEIVDELLARGWWKAAIGRELAGPQALSLQLSKDTVNVANLARLRELLYEPVPDRVHSPTGRRYQPKPSRPPRDIAFTTPGVPVPASARISEQVEGVGMAGKLTCAICGRPYLDHSITERCA